METFTALLALCAGNSPVSGEFPTHRPLKRSFDLHLNERLSKQSRGWWLKTLIMTRSLWRQCNQFTNTHMAHLCLIVFRSSNGIVDMASPLSQSSAPCNEVTWLSGGLLQPANGLFVEQLLTRRTTIEISNLRITASLRGKCIISQWCRKLFRFKRCFVQSSRYPFISKSNIGQ